MAARGPDLGSLFRHAAITRRIMLFMGARGALSLACVNKACDKASKGGVGLWSTLMQREFFVQDEEEASHDVAGSACGKLRRSTGTPSPSRSLGASSVLREPEETRHGFYRFIEEMDLYTLSAEHERRRIHWIGQGATRPGTR
jgi:hypothetical protein